MSNTFNKSETSECEFLVKQTNNFTDIHYNEKEDIKKITSIQQKVVKPVNNTNDSNISKINIKEEQNEMQRVDNYGNKIVKGKKKHKIAFIDQLNSNKQKKKLVTFVSIARIDYMTINENFSSNTVIIKQTSNNDACACCIVF